MPDQSSEHTEHQTEPSPHLLDVLSNSLSFAFTAALVWLIGATLWRAGGWLRTPEPLPIPLAPAPRTRVGVCARLAAEILLFRSLARASPATWLAAIPFHYGLLVVLIVHVRFLFDVLPVWFVPIVQASGWATLALLAGLAILFARRVTLDRVRRISAPSDYLHLVLLGGIALSGAALKRLWPVDLHRVGEFLRGVLGFDWQSVPAHAGLVAHLAGVLFLMIVFPISKLVHALGVGLVPTFRQRDPGARRGG